MKYVYVCIIHMNTYYLYMHNIHKYTYFIIHFEEPVKTRSMCPLRCCKIEHVDDVGMSD